MTFETYLFAGFGAGKTLSLCAEMLRLSIENMPCATMIVSPDFTRQNRSVTPTLQELLHVSGIRFEHNKSESIITPEWGGVIYLASADRPESLRGANLAAAGIDEISLCDESVYFEVLARVRDPRAKRHAIIGVGTPDGGIFSWAYRRLVLEQSPERTIIFGKTSDNVALAGTNYVQNLQKRYDTNQQLTYLEGLFTDTSNNLINPEWFCYYDKEPENIVWNFALDTAYGLGRDNSAIMAFGENDETNTLYIRAVDAVNFPFPALCRHIQAFCSTNGYTTASRVFVEPKASGVSIVQQLKETTDLNIIADDPPSESKEARILAHSAKIEAGRVYLKQDAAWTRNFLAEIALFPKGKNDDQVDVLTIALRQLEKSACMNFIFPSRKNRRSSFADAIFGREYRMPGD